MKPLKVQATRNWEESVLNLGQHKVDKTPPVLSDDYRFVWLSLGTSRATRSLMQFLNQLQAAATLAVRPLIYSKIRDNAASLRS